MEAKEIAEFWNSREMGLLNDKHSIAVPFEDMEKLAKAYLDLLTKNAELADKLGKYIHTPQAYRIMQEEAEKAYNAREAAEQQVKELRAKQEGMVLVPLEPTEEMIAAASKATLSKAPRAIYKAMTKEAQK